MIGSMRGSPASSSAITASSADVLERLVHARSRRSRTGCPSRSTRRAPSRRAGGDRRRPRARACRLPGSLDRPRAGARPARRASFHSGGGSIEQHAERGILRRSPRARRRRSPRSRCRCADRSARATPACRPATTPRCRGTRRPPRRRGCGTPTMLAAEQRGDRGRSSRSDSEVRDETLRSSVSARNAVLGAVFSARGATASVLASAGMTADSGAGEPAAAAPRRPSRGASATRGHRRRRRRPTPAPAPPHAGDRADQPPRAIKPEPVADIVGSVPGDRSTQEHGRARRLAGGAAVCSARSGCTSTSIRSRRRTRSRSPTSRPAIAWTTADQASVRSRARLAVDAPASFYGIGGASLIAAAIAYIVTEPKDGDHGRSVPTATAPAQPTVAPDPGRRDRRRSVERSDARVRSSCARARRVLARRSRGRVSVRPRRACARPDQACNGPDNTCVFTGTARAVRVRPDSTDTSPTTPRRRRISLGVLHVRDRADRHRTAASPPATPRTGWCSRPRRVARRSRSSVRVSVTFPLAFEVLAVRAVGSRREHADRDRACVRRCRPRRDAERVSTARSRPAATTGSRSRRRARATAAARATTIATT